MLNFETQTRGKNERKEKCLCVRGREKILLGFPFFFSKVSPPPPPPAADGAPKSSAENEEDKVDGGRGEEKGILKVKQLPPGE